MHAELRQEDQAIKKRATKAKADRSGRSRAASGQQPSAGHRPVTAPAGATSAPLPAVWWAAVLCVGALLAAVAMGYDPALVGKYFVPRFALLLPLTLAAVCILVRRPSRRESPGVDVVNVLALALAAWQALAAPGW